MFGVCGVDYGGGTSETSKQSMYGFTGYSARLAMHNLYTLQYRAVPGGAHKKEGQGACMGEWG